MIKTTSYIALAMFIGGGALVGCQTQPRGEREQEGATGMQGEIQQQEGQEEGVESEEREPVGGTELGGTRVREGEAETQVRERTLSSELVEYKIPTVETCEQRGDLNKMEAKHFEALGVPSEAAQRIVQHREQSGPFRDVSQLQQIQGIDSQTMSKIEGKVGVSR